MTIPTETAEPHPLRPPNRQPNPRRTNPAPSHFAALRRTSPKPTRQGAAHFAGEVGRSIYILPRRGEVSARCSASCPPLRTSPAVHGEEQGGRTAGGTDGGRTAADQGRRQTDRRTDRQPSRQFDIFSKSVNLTDFAKVSKWVAAPKGRARPSPASSCSSSPARQLVEGERRQGGRGRPGQEEGRRDTHAQDIVAARQHRGVTLCQRARRG